MSSKERDDPDHVLVEKRYGEEHDRHYNHVLICQRSSVDLCYVHAEDAL